MNHRILPLTERTGAPAIHRLSRGDLSVELFHDHVGVCGCVTVRHREETAATKILENSLPLRHGKTLAPRSGEAYGRRVEKLHFLGSM